MFGVLLRGASIASRALFKGGRAATGTALSLPGVRTAVNEGAVEFNTLLSVVNALSPVDIPAADYPAHQASVYYARASIVE